MTVKDLFKQYPKKATETKTNYFRRLTTVSNFTESSISTCYYRKPKSTAKPTAVKKVKQATEIDQYIYDRKERVLKQQLDEQKKLYKKALVDLEEAEKRFDILLTIKEHSPEHHVVDNIKEEIHAAVPLLVFSDWHVEETVSKNAVNGLNEYSLDIATERIDNLFVRSRKLIQHLQTFNEIKQIYVLLNGDMITGYIHEELRETNSLSPTQAIRFAKERIIGGLNYLRDSLDIDKIIVQCNYGNHGRNTEKRRGSESGYKNSYEWLMYHDLSDYFSTDEKFEFHIAESSISYFTFKHKAKSFILRTWHGDNLKFNGGVGGLTVPLNKLIYRLDQNLPADYNIIGHYHTLFEANKKCLVNGSVIGYNGYAHDLGLEFETPKQAILLLDLDKMEIRSKYTINCD